MRKLFFNFSHISAWGQFDRAVKRSKVNLRSSLNKLGNLESPLLYTKIQPQSFLSAGVAEVFFTIYGHGGPLN